MNVEQKNYDTRAREIVEETKPPKKASEKAVANFPDLIIRPGLNAAQPLGKTSDYLQAALGWVYGCTVAICDDVANIQLRLMKQSGKGVTEVTNHPILDLLNKANDFTTKFDLFWLTQQYLELAGEAPWFLAKNKQGQITDILLLRPDLMDVVPGTDTFVKGYTYRVDGKFVPLDANEVVFFRYPDPIRAFRGKGTLQAAAKTVDIDNFSEDFNRNFFHNSATPGAVLQTEQKLTKDTVEYLTKTFKRLYGGLDNAHKAMILESGLQWKPMMLSQKDMDFLEQQRFSRDKILAIFRVPRTVLGITDDVNRANAEATDYIFAKRTIKPKMQRLVDQLNEFFVPMFAGTENMFLTFADPVPENLEMKLKYYQTGLASGFLTINEVREEIGKDDIGKSGDQIYLPFSMMPIGEVGKQPSAEGSKILGQYLNARNRKSIERRKQSEKLTAELQARITPMIKTMLNKTVKKSAQVKKNSECGHEHKKSDEPTEADEQLKIKQKFWETKIAKTNVFEKKFIEKQLGVFATQKKEVLANMPKKVSMQDIKKWLLDPKAEGAAGQQIFKPIVAAVIAEGAKDGFDLIGVDDELDLSNPIVQNFLKKRTFQFNFEVAEETNALLGNSLAQGVEAGESVPELRKRVEEVFDSMERYRSERIARSEVIRASNWGTEEAYKESGLVEQKVWLTAFDERTCPYCADLDGKTVDLDENFADKGDDVSGYEVDYENVEAPPLHPNCRCTIIPKLK